MLKSVESAVCNFFNDILAAKKQYSLLDMITLSSAAEEIISLSKYKRNSN